MTDKWIPVSEQMVLEEKQNELGRGKMMTKCENNCHGCKWLDRDMKLNIDGNGYCCMVERSSQKHEPQCKIRRPDKVRCELYEAGNWATRFQKGRNNNA